MRIAVTGLRGIPASWGGVEHHCEQIYSRLADKGHEITIYVRSNYVKKDVKSYKGIIIKRLPTINTKFTEAFFHTFLSVLHILKNNPDIIHIHAQGPGMFGWLPRLFRPRMRVFFTCHGLDWQRKKWPWWASKFIYLGELCSTLFPHYKIVVSQELQKYYLARHGVKTYHIPNGVNKSEKRSLDIIKQYGLSYRNYFLFVGRIVPEKRLEDIIQAFLQKPRKIKLVIVGESADTEKYMKDLEIMAKGDSSILFVGYQFGQALEEFYSNARAFITASELEGLPITLLEALSYGLVCIASDIPPHREILKHLDYYTFSTAAVKELVQHMDEVENMPDSTIELFSNKATSMVNTYFNWNTAAEMLNQLYQESLQNR